MLEKKYNFVVIEVYNTRQIEQLEILCYRYLSTFSSYNIKNVLNELIQLDIKCVYPFPLVLMVNVDENYMMTTGKENLIKANGFDSRYNGFQSINRCELFRNMVTYKKKKILS